MKPIFALVLALWALTQPRVLGFSWGRAKKLSHEPRLPDIYAIALRELQELEAAPLCHRVAARLLVNSCELVDGKDEATILTESGPKIRDFVDAYAASLAICDLERGSFVIPMDCAKFQEEALGQLALNNQAHMLVTSSEIDACLTALANSDAAWSTWVSYRHKAVRFCQAARADNEKAESIALYQRLTKVLAKLASSVEVELRQRMEDIEERTRQSLEDLEQLNPRIDGLKEGLLKLQEFLSHDMREAMKKSSQSMNEGRESAAAIQQLLATLVNSMASASSHVVESNSRLVMAQEESMQKAGKDIGALIEAVATAVTTSASLQQQIEISRLHAAELSSRQDALEAGMGRLLNVTEKLSAKYDDHTSLLDRANNQTYEVLDMLGDTASKAALINESFHQESVRSGWWPYIVFPTAALVMGSYGLPPSASRNLGLLTLGEVIAILFSIFNDLEAAILFSTAEVVVNGTEPSL
ncbi:hypothetical protein GQ53DRAFT_725995 [Thozetella sp. PMI_491]|nr:hypothetical protein GQ53DRAFT_725995 [Thozetella sp. PMI_491]